jgi:hypothetical protein
VTGVLLNLARVITAHRTHRDARGPQVVKAKRHVLIIVDQEHWPFGRNARPLDMLAQFLAQPILRNETDDEPSLEPSGRPRCSPIG